MKTPKMTDEDCPADLRERLKLFRQLGVAFEDAIQEAGNKFIVDIRYDIWHSMLSEFSTGPTFRCNMTLAYEDRVSVADLIFKPALHFTTFLELLEKGFHKTKERENLWREQNES